MISGVLYVDMSDEEPSMQKACDLAGCDHCGLQSTCPLNKVGIGCCGTVATVGGDPNLRRRLLEMGFCNGVKVTPSKSACAAITCPSALTRHSTF
jgi:hypothetical protein